MLGSSCGHTVIGIPALGNSGHVFKMWFLNLGEKNPDNKKLKSISLPLNCFMPFLPDSLYFCLLFPPILPKPCLFKHGEGIQSECSNLHAVWELNYLHAINYECVFPDNILCLNKWSEKKTWRQRDCWSFSKVVTSLLWVLSNSVCVVYFCLRQMWLQQPLTS